MFLGDNVPVVVSGHRQHVLWYDKNAFHLDVTVMVNRVFRVTTELLDFGWFEINVQIV